MTPRLRLSFLIHDPWQERDAVILTTVRTDREQVSYDLRHALGFLVNPRRLNGMHNQWTFPVPLFNTSSFAVAVTRAQGLLIVVGDAAILSLDPIWRGFMNHVYQNGGWRGEPPTWDVNAPVLTDADYADELREAIAAEMNAVIAQLPPEEDIEAEANVDRNVWVNEDSTDW